MTAVCAYTIDSINSALDNPKEFRKIPTHSECDSSETYTSIAGLIPGQVLYKMQHHAMQ